MPSDLLTKLKEVGNDTTYLTVVDKDGNIISLIQSLYSEFGTGLVVPGTGMILNNEMGDFNKKPGETNLTGDIGTPANLIAPGKPVQIVFVEFK